MITGVFNYVGRKVYEYYYDTPFDYVYDNIMGQGYFYYSDLAFFAREMILDGVPVDTATEDSAYMENSARLRAVLESPPGVVAYYETGYVGGGGRSGGGGASGGWVSEYPAVIEDRLAPVADRVPLFPGIELHHTTPGGRMIVTNDDLYPPCNPFPVGDYPSEQAIADSVLQLSVINVFTGGGYWIPSGGWGQPPLWLEPYEYRHISRLKYGTLPGLLPFLINDKPHVLAVLRSDYFTYEDDDTHWQPTIHYDLPGVGADELVFLSDKCQGRQVGQIGVQPLMTDKWWYLLYTQNDIENAPPGLYISIVELVTEPEPEPEETRRPGVFGRGGYPDLKRIIETDNAWFIEPAYTRRNL